MFNTQKSIGIVCALLIVLTFAFTAQGQAVKRVQFQKGQSSANFKGSLPRGYADFDAYILRARKGQVLSVKLITDDMDAYLIVYETKLLVPDEERQTPEGDNTREWSGKLPITSEYSVQIYGTRDVNKKGTGKAYQLEISIR